MPHDSEACQLGAEKSDLALARWDRSVVSEGDMAVGKDSCVVEIAVDPEGDTLVAYSDLSLDATASLTLEHSTGALTAILGMGKTVRPIGCGVVSTKMTKALSRVKSVIWARMDGDETINVYEIELNHA